MNIKQAKEEIKNTIKVYLEKDEYNQYKIPSIRQRPILLIGPPGIGKTQIMEQISKECKIGLVSYTITHHTRQSAVGLPFIVEKEFDGKKVSVTEYTMSEIVASIYQKMEETGVKEGILFIDEINCVSETLAPTMLQFLQGKTFGNQAIPEGWIIAGAGNPMEYNKSVREFDMVTLDRVRYLNVEQDLNVWKEYALSNQIHPCILSYLDLKPSHFYHVENDVDGLRFVTARGWEDLSYLMKRYEALQIQITEDVIYEYLHDRDISEDMASYYTLYRKYKEDYGIENILNGKISTSLYARGFNASFDERLSVIHLLLDGLFQRIQTLYEKKDQLDYQYEFLKNYFKNKDTKSYSLCIQEALLENQNQYKSEFITKNRYCMVNQWIQNLKEKELNAKESFLKYKEEVEKTEENCIQSMNSCFEYLDSLYSNGQEMVIFVTGLSLQSQCAIFLSENEIPLYEKYKQELLIGTKRKEIMDILNS